MKKAIKTWFQNKKWTKVWDKEPPKDEEILFVVDQDVYLGLCSGCEKLRKCDFKSCCSIAFSADTSTPIDKKVTHWMLVPEPPKEDNER